MIKFNKVVIIGTGLIGASFSKAIKAHNICQKIYGFDTNSVNLQTSLELGHIDFASTNPNVCVDADFIFISVPVSQTKNALERIKNFINPKCVLTDAGSVKTYVKNSAKEVLQKKYPQFCPSHPIAGSDKDGPMYASENLFKSKTCILTPSKNTLENTFNVVKETWESIGANTHAMSSFEHDKIYAHISHLPHLLSFALVNETMNQENYDIEKLFSFAGTGYTDTSRLAASNSIVWADICKQNKENILVSLNNMTDSLNSIKDLIYNNEFDKLEKLLSEISLNRRKLPEIIGKFK